MKDAEKDTRAQKSSATVLDCYYGRRYFISESGVEFCGNDGAWVRINRQDALAIALEVIRINEEFMGFVKSGG